MFTRLSIQGVRIFIQIASFSKSIPYHWDPVTNSLKNYTNKFDLFLWSANIAWCWFYTSFQVYQILCHFLGLGESSEWNSSELLYAVYQLTLGSMGALFHLNTVIHRKEISCWFNGFFKFNAQLQEKYIKTEVINDKKRMNVTELVFFTFIPTAYIHAAFLTFIFTQESHNSRYFFAIFTKQVFKNPKCTDFYIVYFWGILFKMYYWVIAWNLALFYLFISLMYIFANNFWLHQMQNVKKNPPNQTICDLRRVHVVATIYRALGVLNNDYNRICSLLIITGQKVIILTIHVLLSWATIRLFGIMAMPGFLAMPLGSMSCFLFEVVAYPAGALLLDASETLKASWFAEHKYQIMGGMGKLNECRKMIFSSRPLFITAGNFFYYKKSTSLTFLLLVTTQTASLLIAF